MAIKSTKEPYGLDSDKEPAKAEPVEPTPTQEEQGKPEQEQQKFTQVPTDEAFYMANLRTADHEFWSQLPWKEGIAAHVAECYELYTFRAEDEEIQKAQQIRLEGWVKITSDGGINNEAFADWFHESAFDDEGHSCSGFSKAYDAGTRQHFIEAHLYVRPLAAKRAQQRLKDQGWSNVGRPQVPKDKVMEDARRESGGRLEPGMIDIIGDGTSELTIW